MYRVTHSNAYFKSALYMVIASLIEMRLEWKEVVRKVCAEML